MEFFKRLFGSAVEQAQEFDVAMASCQFESSNKDCSLVQQLKDKQTQNRAHTAHDVDWNTIWCECDKDIYHLIGEFVKE